MVLQVLKYKQSSKKSQILDHSKPLMESKLDDNPMQILKIFDVTVFMLNPVPELEIFQEATLILYVHIEMCYKALNFFQL